MFHRSLRDNIAVGRVGATDDEVAVAARAANATEFIESLPEGYATLVGERGIKLSGGQRQRLAIARAVLRRAPILILDEATSSLDSESERLIQQALLTVMAGRTAIVIAHRLSTVRAMDRLIVLDDGAVVEDGTMTSCWLPAAPTQACGARSRAASSARPTATARATGTARRPATGTVRRPPPADASSFPGDGPIRAAFGSRW